jgi:hypothetical protein
MSTQLPAERKPRHRLIMITGLMLVILIAAGITVLVLHHRSSNPHTAHRPPLDSNTTQVNSAIERRAGELVAALRAGDESRLRDMSLTADDRDNVTAFVAAFGHRDVRIASLETGEFGDTGNLALAVPCKSGPEQQALVLFRWKRTSFISSGWFAIINRPGTADVLPAGCAAP